MKTYVGCKIIKAMMMDYAEFCRLYHKEPEHPNTKGYKIVYPDGYTSWSPKDVFEGAYREISDAEAAMVPSVQ